MATDWHKGIELEQMVELHVQIVHSHTQDGELCPSSFDVI